MCGVRMTLGRPRSGEKNSSRVLAGSSGKTSAAAPSRCRSRIAAASASTSTTRPREALIRNEPARMARIWAAPIIHCVALVSGTCSDTTSARARRSARRRAGLGAAERQLGGRVVEHDVHAQRLGHHAELRADIAVADDPQRLAAHFPAVGGGLDPLALMRRHRFREDAPHQHDDLAEHQLGDAARVGERRVEDGDRPLPRVFQCHLVGADAEAAQGDEPVGSGQHARRHLGARADARADGRPGCGRSARPRPARPAAR